MIRRTKHASTATCTLPIYIGFLMTEPNSISCTQLAETYNISHDSVNRFLEREDYTPHDLYQEAIQHIDNNKLIVSIDDTVLDKPYSQHMDLVSYFWSGKHHRSVKGIHLITLYATDQIKIFQLIFETAFKNCKQSIGKLFTVGIEGNNSK